ncbi:GntR family transcriptional regulator [Arthrobacter sp. StoSoilB13]|uniref:GntR family transcriptional regulator n=1 Tax=Arthrobacter sp. StoSoilB13 TaxID=2830993 RepID=UPI003207BCCC
MEQGSVVSEVAERLLAYFTSGDIAPGTRLPAERNLAASLGVGRSAIREGPRRVGDPRYRHRAPRFGNVPARRRLRTFAPDAELGTDAG